MPLGRWEYDRSKRPIYLARCESARRPNAEIPHHSPLPRPGHIHGLGTTHHPATKVQTAKSLSRYVAPSMSLTRWDRSEALGKKCYTSNSATVLLPVPGSPHSSKWCASFGATLPAPPDSIHIGEMRHDYLSKTRPTRWAGPLSLATAYKAKR